MILEMTSFLIGNVVLSDMVRLADKRKKGEMEWYLHQKFYSVLNRPNYSLITQVRLL